MDKNLKENIKTLEKKKSIKSQIRKFIYIMVFSICFFIILNTCNIFKIDEYSNFNINAYAVESKENTETKTEDKNNINAIKYIDIEGKNAGDFKNTDDENVWEAYVKKEDISEEKSVGEKTSLKKTKRRYVLLGFLASLLLIYGIYSRWFKSEKDSNILSFLTNKKNKLKNNEINKDLENVGEVIDKNINKRKLKEKNKKMKINNEENIF